MIKDVAGEMEESKEDNVNSNNKHVMCTEYCIFYGRQHGRLNAKLYFLKTKAIFL
jgi:hypothetical protein